MRICKHPNISFTQQSIFSDERRVNILHPLLRKGSGRFIRRIVEYILQQTEVDISPLIRRAIIAILQGLRSSSERLDLNHKFTTPLKKVGMNFIGKVGRSFDEFW